MAKLNFNAAAKEPMKEFSTIPDGKYLSSIVNSEIKKTKDGKGKRLNFQFKILNGEHKGSIIFVGLNLENKSQKAVEISDRELKSICDAVGKGKETLTDSEHLHGLPMEIEVGTEPPSGEYMDGGEKKFKFKARNKITAYAPAEGSSVLSGSETIPLAEGASTLPWKDEE